MRKPQNVYGKRSTAQQTLAASIFAASSSPFKGPSSPERHLRDTPERRRRQQEEKAGIVKDSEGEDDIGSIVEELGELQLEPGNGQDETKAAHTGRRYTGPDQVLKEKDTNTATGKEPRRRRRKVVSSSPESAVPNQETHATQLSKYESGAPGKDQVDERQVEERIAQSASLHASQRPYAVPETPTTPLARRKRLVQRKRQLSLTPSALNPALPTPPPSDTPLHDSLTAYAHPLLTLCNDPQITPFQTWANDLSSYFTITKIAEASYGEVYWLSLLPSIRNTSTISHTDESVLKVIALKPPPPPSPPTHQLTAKEAETQAAQSSIPSVANEVRLLRHMSPVPGFTNFRDAKVLRGRLPSQFVKAWKDYNRDVKESLFPDPGRKGSCGEGQLWAVVEMEDAGGDVEGLLEKLVERSGAASDESGRAGSKAVSSKAMSSKPSKPSKSGQGTASAVQGITPTAIWDIFWSVTLTVAKGEEYAEFEHRDLHVGNICVKPSAALNGAASSSIAARSKADTCLDLMTATAKGDGSGGADGAALRLGSTGLETTIIDYTLSRASIPWSCPSATLTKEEDEDIAFFDLSSDLAIFEGDAEEEYQYEIYRHMRAALLCGDPAASVPTEVQSDTRSKKGKARKGRRKGDGVSVIETDLRNDETKEGKCETDAWRSSCRMTNLVWLHFVLFKLLEAMAPAPASSKPSRGRKKGVSSATTSSVSEVEQTLRQRLRKLSRLLEIEKMAKGQAKSAIELVGWAVDEGWLREEDVVGRTGAQGTAETFVIES